MLLISQADFTNSPFSTGGGHTCNMGLNPVPAYSDVGQFCLLDQLVLSFSIQLSRFCEQLGSSFSL